MVHRPSDHPVGPYTRPQANPLHTKGNCARAPWLIRPDQKRIHKDWTLFEVMTASKVTVDKNFEVLTWDY